MSRPKKRELYVWEVEVLWKTKRRVRVHAYSALEARENYTQGRFKLSDTVVEGLPTEYVHTKRLGRVR